MASLPACLKALLKELRCCLQLKDWKSFNQLLGHKLQGLLCRSLFAEGVRVRTNIATLNLWRMQILMQLPTPSLQQTAPQGEFTL